MQRTERRSFIVADLETLVVIDKDKNEIHKPYAAGLMRVMPGEELNDLQIDTYFSEDYSIILDSFEERSTKVLVDFIHRIESIVRKSKSPFTIYFHNFSRFDGIILLKPLLRNHRLYEVVVYSGKKMLFRFRDSLNLLPGKLALLANNLCPELGSKGSIPHEKIDISYIQSHKSDLIEYLRQDILLLGGIMKKVQEIYFNLYKVDIVSKITLSSLALTIFRMNYYDAWPIHIPNQNEDTFIRRAYYGGHVDVYKPKGEKLYYYDVNSLYPYIMKTFPMPGGKPVWHSRKWCPWLSPASSSSFDAITIGQSANRV